MPRVATPPRRDLLLALVLTAATQVELWTQADRIEGSQPFQVGIFAAATLAVVFRRVWPLLAVTCVSAALAVQTVFAGDAPVVGGFVAAVIVAYSVAAHASPVRAVLGGAVLALALAANLVDADERAPAEVAGNYLVFGAIWGLGWALRSRRRRADELEERAELLERERDAQTRAAVAEERARVARELHDVIAHNVSVMVLQAGAARQVLGADDDPVRDALLSVERKGREALDEMRRLLGILRRDGDELSLAPQPGLADLPALAAAMREAGLPVALAVEGERPALPAGLELSAYRIVQEALTNALKHAAPTNATVVVRFAETAIELEIADDGRGPAGNGGGHGLVGMRERAAIFGGTLETDTPPEGGFAVRARLPLEPRR